MKDLGLSYEEAMHGVQSAIRFRMTKQGVPDDGGDAMGQIARYLKHSRTGIDASKSDMLGLVELLIEKGVFTKDEYIEKVRLAANQELHGHQELISNEYGIRMDFR